MHRPKAPEKKAPVLDDEGNEMPPEEEEDQEELAKKLKPTLHKHIFPESVISLRATDQQLKRRARATKSNKSANHEKWEDERLYEKMTKYNSVNNLALFKQDQLDKSSVFPTAKFFQENETELFETEVYDNRFEMFESMRIYVERNGRPNNYLDNVRKLNEEREKVLQEEERKDKIVADKAAQEKKTGGAE